ncbi:hypothetical protein [Mucilaginibacter antarcticus]|uniref:hypothetical protein n=1 Tax=Mucilaginibacter antarcticus TaxID=1855725 RepID=UPI00362555A3
MKQPNTVYRKNSSLIIAFLTLVTATLIVGLVVAYKLTARNVEVDFTVKKITLQINPLSAPIMTCIEIKYSR